MIPEFSGASLKEYLPIQFLEKWTFSFYFLFCPSTKSEGDLHNFINVFLWHTLKSRCGIGPTKIFWSSQGCLSISKDFRALSSNGPSANLCFQRCLLSFLILYFYHENMLKVTRCCTSLRVLADCCRRPWSKGMDRYTLVAACLVR